MAAILPVEAKITQSGPLLSCFCRLILSLKKICAFSGIRLWHGQSLAVIMRGHTGSVCAVVWGSDGNTVCSASSDTMVRVWTRHGDPVDTLKGHSGFVHCICDGLGTSPVISGSSDCTVRVWPSFHADLLRPQVGHKGPVWCVSASSSHKLLASGGLDGVVKVFSSFHLNYIHSICVACAGLDAQWGAGALLGRPCKSCPCLLFLPRWICPCYRW